MTLVVQETLRILCKALGAEAIPAGDVARVEQWTELPGFTVDRFRKIVLDTQQRGVRVSSVRYWEGAVADTFRPLPAPLSERQPRLLSRTNPNTASIPMCSSHRIIQALLASGAAYQPAH